MARTPAPDQPFRRKRLDELAQHSAFKSRAVLGRVLGFKDASYIGQMIEGHRPITEKLIARVDALRGGKFRGWFDRAPKSGPSTAAANSAANHGSPPAPPPGFEDRHWVDDSDWATLQAVRGTMTQEQIDDLKRRHKIMLKQVEEMRWGEK